jgi:hypothetical protein
VLNQRFTEQLNQIQRRVFDALLPGQMKMRTIPTVVKSKVTKFPTVRNETVVFFRHSSRRHSSRHGAGGHAASDFCAYGSGR